MPCFNVVLQATAGSVIALQLDFVSNNSLKGLVEEEKEEYGNFTLTSASVKVVIWVYCTFSSVLIKELCFFSLLKRRTSLQLTDVLPCLLVQTVQFFVLRTPR